MTMAPLKIAVAGNCRVSPFFADSRGRNGSRCPRRSCTARQAPSVASTRVPSAASALIAMSAAPDPFAWDFSPPSSPALGDHEVPLRSRHLQGRHIALMVCGGIAAFKAPLLARALRRHGAEVTAFCSEEALPPAVPWSRRSAGGPNISPMPRARPVQVSMPIWWHRPPTTRSARPRRASPMG
jgi:hypothetical protein